MNIKAGFLRLADVADRGLCVKMVSLENVQAIYFIKCTTNLQKKKILINLELAAGVKPYRCHKLAAN